ncbi:TfuA-related McrA-glycine thioamidation protein [Methanochimaera problematica]|uniref:TfuA-related McrA-glycine thioamidation protein n=1 Tax=Methanochimaera problematica TaxID=2609417 RepID=UPI0029393ED9|nr:TfuA-related McrA-glycine thioamidation protein [Methanoplanus sp. FWC-SCC4]
MPDVIVYLGPSLRRDEAEEILSPSVAEFRPPVKRGDLEKAVLDKPKVVCIIDGLFFQDCSVGHREILKLLKSGIKVYGSSSMGALRACELEPFGMTGVGRVFEMFRDGVIESDDEVALACDPFTDEAVSDALVDIRINLESAVFAGVISKKERDVLIKTASGIYYPNRTYRKVLKTAKAEGLISVETFERLSGYLKEHSFSQKEKDAKELLRVVGEMLKRNNTLTEFN